MTMVNVLVSVRDDYMDQIPVTVKKLHSAGMTNIQSMDDIGIITGSIDENKIAGLSSIEGVASVERSQEYQLSPLESPASIERSQEYQLPLLESPASVERSQEYQLPPPDSPVQ